MSKSSIEWTDATWNPTTGCTPVKGSPACQICYAIPQSYRNMLMGLEKYKNNFKLTVHQSEILRPYKWKKPKIVFVNSMSDLFHKDVPLEFLIQVFATMNNTRHIYQILTKRAERLAELCGHLNWSDNIWMGVSVENEAALERVEYLKKTTAKVKFLSVEPLAEALPNLDVRGLDWVIVGGASGHKAYPTKEEWVLEILEKCQENNVPFFFKQWGKKQFNPNPLDPTIDAEHPLHAKGGCELRGIVYREMPPVEFKKIITI